MSDKKVREMSPKGFLHKSSLNAAKSATAFLEKHREWLVTGELAEATKPILSKMDCKEIMPTPALQEIRQAVLNHMLASDMKKSLEVKIREVVEKNHIATIFTKEGDIKKVLVNGKEVELRQDFNLPQEAQRWADRRLDSNPDCYATVVSTKTNSYEEFSREDSMKRLYGYKPGPVMKGARKSTSRLSFGVKASQDHAHFSRG